MISIDFKAAIMEDVKEIDLALRVLNSLMDTTLTKLALITEAEKIEKKQDRRTTSNNA